MPHVAAEATAKRARRRRWLIPAVKLALLAAVVWYVGAALFNAVRQTDWSGLFFRPQWMLLGVGLLMCGVFAGTTVFRTFYRQLGTKLTLSEGVSLFTVPMLGAYLPGRAFYVAGHVAIARTMGVPLSISGAGVFLLAGLGVLAGILVGLLLLLLRPIPGIDAGYFRLSLGAALALTLPVLHPRLYFGIVNLVRRAAKKRPLRVDLRLPTMASLLGGMCLYAVFFIAGFVAMGRSIMAFPLAAVPTMIGAISLATMIGLLALFAPGGLGVREGLLLLFLSPVVGEATAGLLAVSLRLLQILVDVALAGIGYAIFRRLQKGKAVRH